ncbi:MAG: hypothetical protein V4563_16020 [Pseudomonadota bacterium]
MKASFGQLWKHSPLWRFTLLGTGIAAAIFLIYPPWQSDTLQPIKTTSPSPKIATVSHGSDGNAASSMLPNMVTPTILPSPPAAKLVVDPQPESQPILAHHPVEHPRRMAKIHQETNEQNPVTAVTPVINHSTPPAATAELSKGISSEIVAADQNCNGAGPMVTPLNPPLPVQGKIIAFIPPSQALAIIPKSEQLANGKIDPHYVHNLRVAFHPDGAPPNEHALAVVAMGMNAYIGEQVRFVGGHASPDLACHYIPNLVMEESR